MKRAPIAVALLLVVLLLVWSACMSDSGRGRSSAAATDAIALDEDDAGRVRTRRDREKQPEDEVEEAATPDLSPFLAGWPEIGQDREQDPNLASVSGRVMLAPETPASEAVVDAVRGGTDVARVHVPGNGRFHLKNVPPGNGLALVARAPGHAPGGIEKLALRAGKHMDVGTFFVGAALDPNVDNSLGVQVLDPAGAPVEGATVTATTQFYGALLTLGPLERQPGGTVVRQVTGADGRAAFEKIPPGSYDVLAEAEGLTFDVRRRYVVQHDTHAKLEMRLKKGVIISGTVLGPDGEPFGDARVGCLQWNTWKNFPATTSADDGTFVLSGLDDGTYFVFAGDEKTGSKDVRNVKAGTQDLVIQIEVGGEMAIRVTDAATGEVVTRYNVRPYRNTPFAYLFAASFEVTAEDGIFRMRMPESAYGIEVSAPGYALFQAPSVPLDNGTPAEDGTATFDAEPFAVQLDPAAQVHGRVVGKTTGSPIVGAQVYVKRGGFPPTAFKDLQTTTDSQGLFTLGGLAPAPINLWVVHVDHTEQSFEGVTPVVVVADVPAQPETFALGSGGTIEGRVFQADSVPAVGETIILTTSGFDFTMNRTTEVDANGGFRFGNVPPGRTYTVSVGSNVPGQQGRSKSGVSVQEDGVTTVDFGVIGGGATITGVVLKDGAPAANCSMSLVSDGADGGVVQKRTDGAGAFAFENVPPGRYQITAAAGRRRSVTVDVREGETPEPVEIVLVASGVEGVVVDAATGEPISGAFVQCQLVFEGAQSNLAAVVKGYKGDRTTAEDGSFRFEGLEQGVYRLRVSHDARGVEISDDIPLAEGQVLTGIRMLVGPGGTLAGTVTNAAGAPVEGASLQLLDGRGRPLFFVSRTQSSSDGGYNQAGVKPGTYTISFEKDGYAPATRSVTVAADGVSRTDFVMISGGRIVVSALDPSGAPVADAIVALLDAAGKVVTKGLTISNLFSAGSARTDASGAITVPGLAPGKYRVVVNKDGIQGRSAPVEVFEGVETPVEVVLDAGE